MERRIRPRTDVKKPVLICPPEGKLPTDASATAIDCDAWQETTGSPDCNHSLVTEGDGFSGLYVQRSSVLSETSVYPHRKPYARFYGQGGYRAAPDGTRRRERLRAIETCQGKIFLLFVSSLDDLENPAQNTRRIA